MLDNLFPKLEWTWTIFGLNVSFRLSSIIEILIFAVVAYYIIAWIKKTKAWNLLKGALVLLGVYLLSKLLGFNNIAFVFERFFGSLLIAVIIIFQPEIRRALEQLGTKNILFRFIQTGQESTASGLQEESIDAIVRALSLLGRNKVGALIVIERTIVLNEYIDTGIRLDARITTALLEQIFEHNTPLHDGAVIIRNNRVEAATCYLPLSENMEISKELGTRHRAGLGISEVSDCITLIASEETGFLSIAMDGGLERNVTTERIRDVLKGEAGQEEELSIPNRIRKWRGRRKNEG